MIGKYFNGVIEQVYHRIGQEEQNIVMACYGNSLSVSELETVKRYSEEPDGVFFACTELEQDRIVGAYEPFLDIICEMFRRYETGSFEDFLEECDVYHLQMGVLKSYYETGQCVRSENVLLNEVVYEQHRMTEAVATMICRLAEAHPVMIVINRFQYASRSTVKLLNRLLQMGCRNIGVVLGINEQMNASGNYGTDWDQFTEALEELSQVYHIGNSTDHSNDKTAAGDEEEDWEQMFTRLRNMVELLDFAQASVYIRKLDRQIRFEDLTISDEEKIELYSLYIKISILCGDIPKALELTDELSGLRIYQQNWEAQYYQAYFRGNCYMYQGKLAKGVEYAKKAQQIAKNAKAERLEFEAELLAVQNQMSGWYNIFFCAQDVPIQEDLIEKLKQYGYWNNLAHIYVYAYDNQPEVVARAYHSEESLVHFSMGTALAKEIGNEQLVYDAYQKNIMIAATSGMNEIAILYSVRTYQFLQDKRSLQLGRIYSGLGYNLSAMGEDHRAETFYQHAIGLFCELKFPDDIAEVRYNMSLNDIMRGKYADAEQKLLFVMKTIERLHMNSLRVCNLSKLYGLLALVSILQKDRFNCERYLLSCHQFLSYVLEKEKNNNLIGIVHDYAKCDDDMFLYLFSKGLLCWQDGAYEDAACDLDRAEQFLLNAEGNQYFSYELFRKKRMELFRFLGRKDCYEKEKEKLEQYQIRAAKRHALLSDALLKEVEESRNFAGEDMPEERLEALMKQEGVARDLKTARSQMEFLSRWQKLVDVNGAEVHEVVETSMHMFLNHFNNDCALYIRFHSEGSEILYNDTGVAITDEVVAEIRRSMCKYPQGLVVSKISGNYPEHMRLISLFGADDVCSIAAVPIFNNWSLKSVFITYIRMRENWHSSIDRYMLNEDDLNIYDLLMRDLNYSINRIEAYDKIFEMNRKLAAAATTDMLTGIYNRAGMYQEVEHKVRDLKKRRECGKMGLMFIDLDNFKLYNDTFGHDIGDVILQSMASIFTEVTGEQGFVSRFGGDEFIIILDTDEKTRLEEIAKEIYRKIDSTDGFEEDISNRIGQNIKIGQNQRITCSIGIAASDGICEENDVNELIRKADDMLYHVKMNQKGTYAFI